MTTHTNSRSRNQKFFFKKHPKTYGTLPNPLPFGPQASSIDFFDTLGFRTNVKMIREGDWICFFCQNLNFSFRNECNRCQANAHSNSPTENLIQSSKNTIFQDNLNWQSISFKDHQRLNCESRNELFEKVCSSDCGFSNVVLIDFEIKENFDDSVEDFDELGMKQQYEATPILHLIDE